MKNIGAQLYTVREVLPPQTDGNVSSDMFWVAVAGSDPAQLNYN